MRFDLGRTLLAVLSVTVMVSSIFSAPSRLLNYQGRLTDGSGQPISGTFRVGFIIYDAPTGGSALWEERNEVTVESDGLFAILLGSTTQIPSDLFDGSGRYLGIRVEGDPELTPRSLLTTVPTAFYSTNAQNAQTAQTATTAPNYLPLSGGTMTGTTFHNSAASRWQSGGSDRIVVDPNNQKIQIIGSNGVERARLCEEGPGELILTDSSLSTGGAAFLTAAGWGGGGSFILDDTMGFPKVFMNTGWSGNSSVILPDSAIDSREILNEPGIAASSGPWTSLLASDLISVDLASIVITIPAPGYIVVDAQFDGRVSGTTGSNLAMVAIDETIDNVYWAGLLVYFGENNALTVGYKYFPISFYRVYYKPAGSYTFHLKGRAGWPLDPAAVIECLYPHLKATYYPTSYGSVATMVSSAEAGQFENSEAVSVPTGLDGKGPATTMYRVDLRELELKAAKLRAETEKAERELAEAKMNEMRKQQVQNVSDKK